MREIGNQAMKMLLGKLNASASQSETPENSLVVLKAELRIRESTAAPPKR